MTWHFCGHDFMVGEVVRWEEPIWGRKSPRSPDEIVGKRMITAQVMWEENGWLGVEIIEEVTLEYKLRGVPEGINKKTRRLRSKVEKGHPQRMLWDDESARDVVVAEGGSGKNVSYETRETGK